MSQKKHYHIVEIRNFRLVDELRSKLAMEQARSDLLQRQLDSLVLKYGSEVQYNNALCDLLRSHGIPFKSVFEHSVRYLK